MYLSESGSTYAFCYPVTGLVVDLGVLLLDENLTGLVGAVDLGRLKMEQMEMLLREHVHLSFHLNCRSPSAGSFHPTVQTDWSTKIFGSPGKDDDSHDRSSES